MKKGLYIIAAAFCCLVVSCTDTATVHPDGPQKPVQIELSDTKLIFDVDGGCVAVVVATTADEWNYTMQGDWFTVERKADNTLEILAPSNALPMPLTGSITVSAEKDGKLVEAAISLIQRTDRSENLSAAGTANCYLAKTNRAYKFDASIKGNGGKDGRSTYLQVHGVKITDVAYADLLWEARLDGDKTLSREVIDGAPIYRDGYIAFSTGRSEGNALIAARDINGNILWSWHIWILNEEIKVHDHLVAEDQVVAQVMDRNLGAMNNTPMDLNNRGMFYQWGRKDPFPPSRSAYVREGDDTPEGMFASKYNLQNEEVGNGSGEWNLHVQTLPLADAIGNIPNAIQHPMWFLVPFYSDSYDWHSSGSGVEVKDSGLWDETKTIFDPCPVGYKVPGKNMWGIPGGNASIDTAGRVEEYDEKGESPKYSWNAAKDGGRCWKFTGDFYPLSGNVTIVEKNPVHNTSVYGFYWTSQRSPSAGTSFLAKFTSYWGQYTSTSHIFSGQIRCVKE